VRQFWSAFSKVPPRLKREHLDEELYCLALYLRALSSARLLKYPLSISAAEESKSPDFLVTSAGKTTGIEVTRATTPELQRTMTASEKRLAANGDIPALDNGRLGDEGPRQWCQIVSETITKKESLLSKYSRAENQELLIYDDTPIIGVDRAVAIPAVQRWMRTRGNGVRRFHRVSIIISLDLVYDVGAEARTIPFVQQSESAGGFLETSARIEDAMSKVVHASILWRLPSDDGVYSLDRTGRIIKEMRDGTRFEMRIAANGEETIVAEVPRA
jgi:hypothetical protein